MKRRKLILYAFRTMYEQKEGGQNNEGIPYEKRNVLLPNVKLPGMWYDW